MHVIEQRVIPEELVVPVADLMKSFDARRVALPWRRLVRARPRGPPRRPGGLDGQVRPQGDEERSRRADGGRRQAGRGQRRPRRRRQGRRGRRREVRRPRDGGGLPALLPRRHPPAGQQGRGRPLPGPALRARARGDRHHRRHAQRHSDVRPFGPQHRHGQRRPPGEGSGQGDLAEQRGGGLRLRRRALRAAGAAVPSVRRRGGSRSARTASRTAGWPCRSGRSGAWPRRPARRPPGRSAPRRCTRTRGR